MSKAYSNALSVYKGYKNWVPIFVQFFKILNGKIKQKFESEPKIKKLAGATDKIDKSAMDKNNISLHRLISSNIWKIRWRS